MGMVIPPPIQTNGNDKTNGNNKDKENGNSNSNVWKDNS
jgi:hypothetical protein